MGGCWLGYLKVALPAAQGKAGEVACALALKVSYQVPTCGLTLHGALSAHFAHCARWPSIIVSPHQLMNGAQPLTVA